MKPRRISSRTGRPRLRPRGVPTIVRKLRELRIEQQATLDRLATRVGFNAYTIGRWERGTQLPTLFALSVWAEALGYELVLRERAERLLSEPARYASKQKLMGGRA